jgi:hypothetical protein
MANFFQDVLKNVDAVQQDLLGPDYEYWKQVRTPGELGMSGSGNISALSRDIAGLVDYVEVLVGGGGGASKVNGPMGNKFFLKTGAKCKDVQSGKKVDRFMYVNNVPDGTIPFISQGLGGMTFPSFKGLVPGALGDLNVLNPFAIFQSFMMGNYPDCQPLTMQTIDANNNSSQQTQYVATVDIRNMNPCWFSNNRNPITGAACQQAFQNMIKETGTIDAELPDGIVPRLFLASVGGLSLYLLYKLMHRKRV